VAAGAGGLSHFWGSWSPDSTRILFVRVLVEETYDTPRTYQYAVVTLADDRVVNVGPELDISTQPYWSPDGRQIVIVKNDSHPVPALLLDPDGVKRATETTWLADNGGGWQRVAR